MPTILNTEQAAAYVQLVPNTLEKFRIRGDGPPFMKVGRAVRYRAADLEAWLTARTVKSTSQRFA